MACPFCLTFTGIFFPLLSSLLFSLLYLCRLVPMSNLNCRLNYIHIERAEVNQQTVFLISLANNSGERDSRASLYILSQLVVRHMRPCESNQYKEIQIKWTVLNSKADFKKNTTKVYNIKTALHTQPVRVLGTRIKLQDYCFIYTYIYKEICNTVCVFRM